MAMSSRFGREGRLMWAQHRLGSVGRQAELYTANGPRPTAAGLPSRKHEEAWRALPVAIGVLMGALAAIPVDPARAQGLPASEQIIDASRQAFEAQPEAERKLIQDALVWIGVYNGAPDGTFGRRTFEAILAFETKSRLAADGVLDQRERKMLTEAADRAKAQAGFKLVTDPISGVRIGVPQRVLDKTARGRTGSVYSNAKDQAILTLFVPADPSADLASLFDTLKDNTPSRKVSYKLLRPEFLVVTGTENGRRYFTRIARGETGAGVHALRGFTVAYPSPVAPKLDRLTIAIANSFEPFPTGAAVAPSAPAPSVASPAPLPPPAPELVGTGVVVAQGQVLTAATLPTRCADLLVADAPAKVRKIDRASDLVVLEAPSVSLNSPIQVAAAASADDETVSIPTFVTAPPKSTGVPPPSALAIAAGAIVSTPGPLRVRAPLQGAPGGSPMIGRSGSVLGLIKDKERAPAQVAGVVPEMSYEAVPPDAIAAFLKEARIATDQGGSPPLPSTGAVAAAWKPRLVAIFCSRQRAQ